MTGTPANRNPRHLPTLLDIEQVAGHLGVTVRHVRRLVSEHRIPYVKWGHYVRFDPAEVANWIATNRIPVHR